MPESIWNLDSLFAHFTALRQDDHDANDKRFQAQEVAIDKAESNRDVAIKKAEDSIEKKSDAVYVKVTDLQTELGKVMLRPEIEGRFKSMQEKLDKVDTGQTSSDSKKEGASDLWKIILGALAGAATIWGFLK